MATNTHSCSRNGCPPKNVSGNKIQCFMCARLFYGKCFGIDKCFYEALAPSSPFTEDANIQFICPSCLRKPKEGTGVSTDLVSDLCKIRDSLNTIVESQLGVESKLVQINGDAENVNQKINDLVSLGTNTNELCQSIGNKLEGELRKPLFSSLIKTGGSFSPPVARAVKRTRTDTGTELLSSSEDVPMARSKPKLGALDAIIGPAVPQISTNGSNVVGAGLRLGRSLWASRFHPETTVEQVLEYLMEKVGCNGDQLNCRKLVKKDADLTSMQFVSFKIDSNEDIFKVMENPQIWPKYIMIREFNAENKGANLRTARLSEVSEVNSRMEIDQTVSDSKEGEEQLVGDGQSEIVDTAQI